MVRRAAGEEPEPTAAMIDSQSAKSVFSADAGTVGLDGDKKVRGRKRNIVADTLGLLLVVLGTAAIIHDVHPGHQVNEMVAHRRPAVSKMWGDTAYRGAAGHASVRDIGLKTTTKGLGVKGFQPFRQRWTTERTLGRLGRSRRIRPRIREHTPLP
ncbi:transposase [Streptomyces sp. L2]|uniref:transposase n=1 Tax=Streptomyces sp. L2 TaxID=2162665 RepID=UPI0010137471|nr:transposase [Streptomyces sp. L2]